MSGGENAGEIGPLEEAWRIFDAKHLPYRLLMLGKLIDRLSVQQVRDLCGLSLAEWRVLAHIAVMGSKSASAVSAAALVDPAEVSRAVRSLEAGGLMTRVDNPRNRKSSLLLITAAGQDVYKSVYKQRRDFFEQLTGELTTDELSALDELLLRLARQADRIAQRGVSRGKATRDCA